ncbi:MAG: hypothetical protein FWG40_00470 [Peptococcaceae bacterium]|nr:hypothetical protein [Peptococcaceae bacterium]
MTKAEMITKIMETYARYEDDYYYVGGIGIRFENKDREIGEICEDSKDNSEREDERSFPEFGTDEYELLPTLDGTSAWHIIDDDPLHSHALKSFRDDIDVISQTAAHCYVIASDEIGNHPHPDHQEILLRSPIVLAVIF